jgi:glycosyltransferase involved in cell wall biosynthesis
LDRNVGLARARNTGISRSTGTYLAFLDDDDLRIPGSLDKQVKILSGDEKAGFVYGQVHVGDWETCVPTGEVRPKSCKTGDIFWELLNGNFIYVPSVLVRRDRFEAIGLFASDLPGTEDWDAWIRLSAANSVEALQEPVAIYRDFSPRSGQMSANRPKMCRSSARTLAKALRSPRALAAEPGTRRRIRSEYADFLWEDLTKEGHKALSERKLYYAAVNFATAMQINPGRAMRIGTVAGVMHNIIQSVGARSRS